MKISKVLIIELFRFFGILAFYHLGILVSIIFILAPRAVPPWLFSGRTDTQNEEADHIHDQKTEGWFWERLQPYVNSPFSVPWSAVYHQAHFFMAAGRPSRETINANRNFMLVCMCEFASMTKCQFVNMSTWHIVNMSIRRNVNSSNSNLSKC